MTKKSLLKRSNEFKEYEEQVLYSVQHRFTDYGPKLENHGFAMDIDLLWFKNGNNESSLSRIEFTDGYVCAICIQIRRKEDPKYDIDLKALNFIHPIAQIGLKLFHFGSCYERVPEKMFQEFLDDT